MNIATEQIEVTPAQKELLELCGHKDIGTMLESVSYSHDYSIYFLREGVEPIPDSSYFTSLLVNALRDIDRERLIEKLTNKKG